MSFNETFALLFHSLKLVLMLPIIIYNGMSLAYIFGDVTSGISKRCFGASLVALHHRHLLPRQLIRYVWSL